MQRVKRYWRSATLMCVMTVVVAGAWWRGTAGGAMVMQAPPGFTVLSEVDRDSVRLLLADLALDREALIALNPSASQAESVLNTVRTWEGNNRSTVTELRRTIDQKIVAVRQLEAAEAMGPADPARGAQLALARQDRSTAQAAYRTSLAQLETSVRTLLSTSQQTTWTAIQRGHGQSMPIRMLDLTDSQRIAISKAQRTYQRQMAAASSDTERQSAIDTWTTAQSQILTTEQQSVVQGYHSSYATASGNVNGAFTGVLAVSPG